MFWGSNFESNVDNAIEAHSGYFLEPDHSRLEPHLEQNLRITVPEEL